MVTDAKRIVYVKLKSPLSSKPKPSPESGDKERDLSGPLISGEALEQLLAELVKGNPGLTSKVTFLFMQVDYVH